MVSHRPRRSAVSAVMPRCPLRIWLTRFGGAEDVLPGSAKLFQERMKVLADTVPNGNGKLHLIAGLGHVPHLEDAAKTIPPLVAFLKEGAK